MTTRNRFIGIALIASITLGGIALGMEGNPRYNTGLAIQKALETKSTVAPVGLKEYQKSASDANKSEMEAKKKEVYTRFETQKKQIMIDAETATKALYQNLSTLSESDKLSQKEALYAQFKQIKTNTDTKIKELQSQKDIKINDIEMQYQGTVAVKEDGTVKKDKNTEFAAIEAKKKEIHARFDTQSKQISSEAEVAQKAVYEKLNGLSEAEKKTQKEALYAALKQVGVTKEAKMKDLRAQKAEKLKYLESQYVALKDTKKEDLKQQETKKENVDKEKAKQQIKDKVAQMNSAENAVCKASFETIRAERETNAKARKVAWDAFWEANKGTRKDVFTEDSREDVKDTLSLMRMKIRLIERKYTRTVLSSDASVLEYTLTAIANTSVKTWEELSDYVAEGKTEQFNSLRDGFLSVLKENKRSLLGLMETQATTIKGLQDSCQKKAKLVLAQQDQSDKQMQGGLNAIVNGGSTTDKPTEQK